MSFDSKCLELAEYFFPDVNAEAQRELAQQIQQTVEDFGPPECMREDGHSGPCNGFPRGACSGQRISSMEAQPYSTRPLSTRVCLNCGRKRYAHGSFARCPGGETQWE